MSVYVIGDIHGCYDDLQLMLDKIQYDWDDLLIFTGDYIDRGTQSYEMLKWIDEYRFAKMIFIRGNHEEEFIKNVELLSQIDYKKVSLKEAYNKLSSICEYFDYYGTILQIINNHPKASIGLFKRWASIFKSMPYEYKIRVNKHTYIIVHAGYLHPNYKSKFDKQQFYLYARDEAYLYGGYNNGTIIAGHTPTIFEKEFVYNNGDIFSYYNESNNTHFINVDCGCVYKSQNKNAKLACIRLDDHMIFYV